MDWRNILDNSGFMFWGRRWLAADKKVKYVCIFIAVEQLSLAIKFQENKMSDRYITGFAERKIWQRDEIKFLTWRLLINLLSTYYKYHWLWCNNSFRLIIR